MRFSRLLAVGAVAVLATIGASVARADGVDPSVKITVPKDPTIEPCTYFANTDIYCFTSNDEGNPVPITGPTLALILSDPDFALETDFIYEPDDQTSVLLRLWVEITPTIPGGSYDCTLGAPDPGETPAFNQCPASFGVADNGDQLLELQCNQGPGYSPCTGLLAGEEGSAVITPEPSSLPLLGIGISLVGLWGWKARKAAGAPQASRGVLAEC